MHTYLKSIFSSMSSGFEISYEIVIKTICVCFVPSSNNTMLMTMNKLKIYMLKLKIINCEINNKND